MDEAEKGSVREFTVSMKCSSKTDTRTMLVPSRRCLLISQCLDFLDFSLHYSSYSFAHQEVNGSGPTYRKFVELSRYRSSFLFHFLSLILTLLTNLPYVALNFLLCPRTLLSSINRVCFPLSYFLLTNLFYQIIEPFLSFRWLGLCQ